MTVFEGLAIVAALIGLWFLYRWANPAPVFVRESANAVASRAAQATFGLGSIVL